VEGASRTTWHSPAGDGLRKILAGAHYGSVSGFAK